MGGVGAGGELPKELRAMIKEDQWAGDTPPAYVPLHNTAGEEVGLIVIWYDNFLVLAEDQGTVAAWKQHIEERAQFCNAKWKTPVEKRQVEKVVEFLGLRFRHEPTGWHWQHVSTEKWERDVPETQTRRFFARLVGVIMWDATVSGRGASADQECVDVLRKISSGVVSRRSWGEEVGVTQAEAAVLKRRMDSIHLRDAANETMWFSGSATGNEGVVWMASDASDTTMAFVHLAREGATVPVPAWHEDAKTRHIYFKEMEAARAAIEWACVNFPGHVVVLATDNMAVFWAIKRGYTQVKGAQDDVKRINRALNESKCELEAVLVPGKWNVADQPSRGASLCRDNEKATRRVIGEALAGKSRMLCDWAGKLGETKQEKERKATGWRWGPGMEEEARMSEGFGDENEEVEGARPGKRGGGPVAGNKRTKC